MLLLIAGLAAGALIAWRRLHPEARRIAAATLASLALLSGAVLFLYIVRARGGVWGGVRAYMCFAPLLLVFVVGALRGLRPPLRGALALAFAALLLLLDSRQLYRFLRYKSSDHEDQTRHAAYVAGHVAREHPRRILGRLFLYGLDHYPTEIIWSPPRDLPELRALKDALMFDYVVINDRSPLRLHLIRNPRYVRVNRDDRGAELLIFRRLDEPRRAGALGDLCRRRRLVLIRSAAAFASSILCTRAKRAHGSATCRASPSWEAAAGR